MKGYNKVIVKYDKSDEAQMLDDGVIEEKNTVRFFGIGTSCTHSLSSLSLSLTHTHI